MFHLQSHSRCPLVARWFLAHRVEPNHRAVLPVAGRAAPAFWLGLLGLLVKSLALAQHGDVYTAVPLGRGHELERRVPVLTVVPAHELQYPTARRLERGESRGVRRAVFKGAEESLHLGIVVRHSGA